jgi:hypothetical protein
MIKQTIHIFCMPEFVGTEPYLPHIIITDTIIEISKDRAFSR